MWLKRRDNALVVLLQEFAVNAGFVVEAFEGGNGRHLEQVPIAREVLCEQDHVIGGTVEFGFAGYPVEGMVE